MTTINLARTVSVLLDGDEAPTDLTLTVGAGLHLTVPEAAADDYVFVAVLDRDATVEVVLNDGTDREPVGFPALKRGANLSLPVTSGTNIYITRVA